MQSYRDGLDIPPWLCMRLSDTQHLVGGGQKCSIPLSEQEV